VVLELSLLQPQRGVQQHGTVPGSQLGRERIALGLLLLAQVHRDEDTPGELLSSKVFQVVNSFKFERVSSSKEFQVLKSFKFQIVSSSKEFQVLKSFKLQRVSTSKEF